VSMRFTGKALQLTNILRECAHGRGAWAGFTCRCPNWRRFQVTRRKFCATNTPRVFRELAVSVGQRGAIFISRRA